MNIKLFGTKWAVECLMLIHEKPKRYTDLKKSKELNNITAKQLSHALKLLMDEGLINRTVQHTIPVSVTYVITPSGNKIFKLIHQVMEV